MKSANVAILGHRFMGRAHSNAWINAPFYFDLPVKPTLKVVAGRDEAAMGSFADRWGWEEVSTDWRATVERDDVDIVDIALPTYLHHEAALVAAKAGKHIFCEKPFAMSVAESEQMLEAAQAAGIVHYLNHNYRRCPAVTLARQLIEEGRIGQPYHYRGAYQQAWLVDPQKPIDWKLRKSTAAAGPLWDLGSHAVDLAHYLMGDIESVSCLTTNFIEERPLASDPSTTGKVEVECAALMNVEFESGALGTFETTRYATGRRNRHTFEVYGSKGALSWDMEDMNRLQFYDKADEPVAGGWRDIMATEPEHPYVGKWWPPGHIIGYEHAFVHAVVDFLEAIDQGIGVTPDFADGVRIIRVLEAALSAAESGSKVSL